MGFKSQNNKGIKKSKEVRMKGPYQDFGNAGEKKTVCAYHPQTDINDNKI